MGTNLIWLPFHDYSLIFAQIFFLNKGDQYFPRGYRNSTWILKIHVEFSRGQLPVDLTHKHWMLMINPPFDAG